MEAKATFYEVYQNMTDDEKQICDLCQDWHIEDCAKCQIAAKYNFKQEVMV